MAKFTLGSTETKLEKLNQKKSSKTGSKQATITNETDNSIQFINYSQENKKYSNPFGIRRPSIRKTMVKNVLEKKA